MPDIGIEVAFSCRPWTLEDKVHDSVCLAYSADHAHNDASLNACCVQLGCSFTNTPNPGDEEGHKPDSLVDENGVAVMKLALPSLSLSIRDLRCGGWGLWAPRSHW